MCDGNSEAVFAKGNQNQIIVFPKENFIQRIQKIATRSSLENTKNFKNITTKRFSLEITENSKCHNEKIFLGKYKEFKNITTKRFSLEITESAKCHNKKIFLGKYREFKMS